MEPFGHGNRTPLLAACGVFMNGRQRVGKLGNHYKFTAYDGVASVPAISFRCPNIDDLLSHETAVDLVFEATVDEWRGKTRVQLRVRDVHPRTARLGRAGLRAGRGPVRPGRCDPRSRGVRGHRGGRGVPHQARGRDLRGPPGGARATVAGCAASPRAAAGQRVRRQRMRALRPARRPGRLLQPPAGCRARARDRRRRRLRRRGHRGHRWRDGPVPGRERARLAPRREPRRGGRPSSAPLGGPSCRT